MRKKTVQATAAMHRNRHGTLTVVVVLFVLLSVLGCDRKDATEEDCQVIFDRLVALELAEMGFSDAKLLELKQAEFRARYQAELSSCVGKPISPRALSCVATAQSTEEMSHECMK